LHGAFNRWLKEHGRDYAASSGKAAGGFFREPIQSRSGEAILAGQEEPHHQIGFQEKLRALLHKHEIEWDEKYVWT